MRVLQVTRETQISGLSFHNRDVMKEFPSACLPHIPTYVWLATSSLLRWLPPSAPSAKLHVGFEEASGGWLEPPEHPGICQRDSERWKKGSKQTANWHHINLWWMLERTKMALLVWGQRPIHPILQLTEANSRPLRKPTEIKASV